MNIAVAPLRRIRIAQNIIAMAKAKLRARSGHRDRK
jgi:hypothetical protein